MSARLPKRTRVVVEVRGGVVQGVMADRGVDVLVLDYDCDNGAEDATHIPHAGCPAVVSDGVTVNRKLVGEIFRSLNR